MKSITIAGAGLAGLLAANMLRRSDVSVVEAQPELPNNHSAVLRFRSNEVALQTGIPFRRVRVFKAVHAPVNPVADALAYSEKVLGKLELRSVIETAPVDRWIAPPDLIGRMADGVEVEYGAIWKKSADAPPVISTMPMPRLMDALAWTGPRPEFNSRPGTVIRATLKDADVYATIYYPHALPCYRASITGNELIIEIARELDASANIQDDASAILRQVLPTFGLWGGSLTPGIRPVVKTQRYAKLARLSEEDRKTAQAFMYWATTEHNVYSLGRFATWRAGLLLDDAVQDVRKIEQWIKNGQYALKKDQ